MVERERGSGSILGKRQSAQRGVVGRERVHVLRAMGVQLSWSWQGAVGDGLGREQRLFTKGFVYTEMG